MLHCTLISNLCVACPLSAHNAVIYANVLQNWKTFNVYAALDNYGPHISQSNFATNNSSREALTFDSVLNQHQNRDILRYWVCNSNFYIYFFYRKYFWSRHDDNNWLLPSRDQLDSNIRQRYKWKDAKLYSH